MLSSHRVLILVLAGLACGCDQGSGSAADTSTDTAVDTGTDAGPDAADDPEPDVGTDTAADPEPEGDVEDDAIPSGEIIYTDVDPDVVYTEWDAYSLKLDASLPGDEGQYFIWKHPDNVQIASYDTNCHVLVDGSGLPYALSEGDPVGPGEATWVTTYLAYQDLNNNGTVGNWIGVTDRFLGLRFQRAGSWHYGWARMDIDAAPAQFVLKDYAYQDAADVPILAGAGMP
jgi:hypothetical protein